MRNRPRIQLRLFTETTAVEPSKKVSQVAFSPVSEIPNSRSTELAPKVDCHTTRIPRMLVTITATWRQKELANAATSKSDSALAAPDTNGAATLLNCQIVPAVTKAVPTKGQRRLKKRLEAMSEAGPIATGP